MPLLKPELVKAPIVNYQLMEDTIGSAGLISPEALEELASAGLKTLVDLRSSEEGTSFEMEAASKLGIHYVHLPISGTPIPEAYVTTIGELCAQKDKHPIIIHCASANRVGALWALHLNNKGSSAAQAIQVGKGLGLQNNLATAIISQLK